MELFCDIFATNKFADRRADEQTLSSNLSSRTLTQTNLHSNLQFVSNGKYYVEWEMRPMMSVNGRLPLAAGRGGKFGGKRSASIRGACWWIISDDGLILLPRTVWKLLSDLSYAVCNTVWVRYVSILLFSEKEENKSLCNQSRIIVDSINQVVRERGKRVSSISE